MEDKGGEGGERGEGGRGSILEHKGSKCLLSLSAASLCTRHTCWSEHLAPSFINSSESTSLHLSHTSCTSILLQGGPFGPTCCENISPLLPSALDI